MDHLPVEVPGVRWLNPAEQRAWRSYLVGSTLLTDRLDRDLRDRHDISLPEYEILVRLSEAPRHRMRMAMLAQSASYSRSRVTHTVGRLEQSGYVLREPTASDGRGVEATLTERGHEMLEAAAPTHVGGVREFFVDLAGEDYPAVGAVFERVLEALITEHPTMDIR